MARFFDSSLSMHNSVTGIDTVDFGIFDKIVYEVFNKWAAIESAKQNENWISWIRLTWAGLKAVQPAKGIVKILRISSYQNMLQ